MSTIAVAISTHTLTGRPSASPPRNVKNELWVGRPVTCWPSLRASARPRNIESVASVATIAGIAMTWTRSAFTRPSPPPRRTPIAAATHAFIPPRINSADTISVSPNIEPTERSISRIERRNAIPAARIPT